MTRRPLPELPRIIQQYAGKGNQVDLNGSVLLALESLRRQIFAMQSQINETQNINSVLQGADGVSTINNTIVTLTNKSGSSVENGTVVIKDIANDESFKLSALTGDPTVIGVVAQDSPDGTTAAIIANADGLICMQGLCNVLVDASATAIAAGDFLIVKASTGNAIKADFENSEGVFAMALEAKASGTGLIYCFVSQFPKRDQIVTELITADSTSQCTLTYNACLDADGGALVFIFDQSGIMSFPSDIGTYLSSHQRCVLSSVAKVVTNSANDFSLGANGLYCAYLRSELGNISEIEKFKAIILSYIYLATFSGGLTGGAGYADFNTDMKTIEGAINELKTDIDTLNLDLISNYTEYAYDLSGSVTGISGAMISMGRWYTSAKTTQLIHQYFGYSTDGANILIVNDVASQTITDGTEVRVVAKAFEYTGGLLDKIIQDVTIS